MIHIIPSTHIVPSYVSLKTTKLLFTVQQLSIFQKNQRKIVLGHRSNKQGKCNQLYYES